MEILSDVVLTINCKLKIQLSGSWGWKVHLSINLSNITRRTNLKKKKILKSREKLEIKLLFRWWQSHHGTYKEPETLICLKRYMRSDQCAAFGKPKKSIYRKKSKTWRNTFIVNVLSCTTHNVPIIMCTTTTLIACSQSTKSPVPWVSGQKNSFLSPTRNT